MKKLVLVVCMIGLLISCTAPLDKKFNKETSFEDLKSIKEEVDSSDYKLLSGSLLRLAFKGESIEGMTYSDILEDGKEWKAEQDRLEAEQKALAEKIKKEEEERTKRLNDVLTVALYKKGFSKYNYQEYITYSIAFENKSDRDIRALKGVLTINDLFDTKIKGISLTIDDPIKAGTTYKDSYTTDYNQFKSEDSTLKSKDLDDLKIVWTPEKIIFSDGTTLE